MNQDKLKQIMRDKNLTRQQVADLLMVKKRTVDSWLASEESTNYRNMPDNLLLLMEVLK